MKHLITIAALGIASAWPVAGSATAHTSAEAHGAHEGALTDGEVRRVDKEAKKLTIRHGPIKNLDMPAMTMVFQVGDASILDLVKPGDKIRFNAEKTDGAYTITRIEVAR